VCTRPRERNGLGLSQGETDRRLQLIEQQFLFLPETEATYDRWRQIVVECGVSGVQVHDARLAAVMNVNNIPHLLTLNPQDFKRFTGLTSIHPGDLQPRAT
jgi:predicted nucleic acid-binding protein